MLISVPIKLAKSTEPNRLFIPPQALGKLYGPFTLTYKQDIPQFFSPPQQCLKLCEIFFICNHGIQYIPGLLCVRIA